MPRIAEITKTHDGRPAVVLEPTGDDGVVSFYTDEEIDALLAAEREACAQIVDEFAPGHAYLLRSALQAAIRNRA